MALRFLVKSSIVAGAAVGAATLYVQPRGIFTEGDPKAALSPHPAPRDAQIARLKKEDFDILIIGGGATGSGAALEAVSRGYRVALVERDDFASGSSSKSTKLIHGGVRYLEKAFMEFDLAQFTLVHDALKERANWFRIAPHLSKSLPIVTPVYAYWEVPYYYSGLFMYDLIAGGSVLARSYLLLPKGVQEKFPNIRTKLEEDTKEGKKRVRDLRGAVVYYDGQMNDSRMNVALAATASAHGAAVANHVSVTGLVKKKDGSGQVCGASVVDAVSGDKFEIKAKTVINATGPYSDQIRVEMDDPKAPSIVYASTGVHLILDKSICPPERGLLVPKTQDGRVVFVLPWLGHTLAGTTDQPSPVVDDPTPTGSEVDYILSYVNKYLNTSVGREDVKSAWSGLRPLVKMPSQKTENSASLNRDHMVLTNPSGLVSIIGGKWTTYRKMAEDVINHTASIGKLTPVRTPLGPTDKIRVIGSERWTPDLFARTALEFPDVDHSVIDHLTTSYGDRAPEILRLASAAAATNGSKRQSTTKLQPRKISEKHPYLMAEVEYCMKNEFACSAVDILARRTRLAFLDSAEAEKAVEPVVREMAKLNKWSRKQQEKEIKESLAQLRKMTGF